MIVGRWEIGRWRRTVSGSGSGSGARTRLPLEPTLLFVFPAAACMAWHCCPPPMRYGYMYTVLPPVSTSNRARYTYIHLVPQQTVCKQPEKYRIELFIRNRGLAAYFEKERWRDRDTGYPPSQKSKNIRNRMNKEAREEVVEEKRKEGKKKRREEKKKKKNTFNLQDSSCLPQHVHSSHFFSCLFLLSSLFLFLLLLLLAFRPLLLCLSGFSLLLLVARILHLGVRACGLLVLLGSRHLHVNSANVCGGTLLLILTSLDDPEVRVGRGVEIRITLLPLSRSRLVDTAIFLQSLVSTNHRFLLSV